MSYWLQFDTSNIVKKIVKFVTYVTLFFHVIIPLEECVFEQQQQQQKIIIKQNK